MNIGDKIRHLRLERGITQKELAATLFVSVQAVSKWENGKSMPDIHILPLLAEYFNVSISELFD